jgi:radical SAM superfamily enzyme YgiQ (UPF0313 family)
MKILLVNPSSPDSFWSFSKSLPFIGKVALVPPLGLLTVAALLPRDWDLKLVDMTVQQLDPKHLQWADMVFISSMTNQAASALEVIELCRAYPVKVVVGGPHFTMLHDGIPGVHHYFRGEAEETIPQFISDLAQGIPKRVYESPGRTDMTQVPIPRWDLIDTRPYTYLSAQYSRGCPFDCEFCDISLLLGRKLRHKQPNQVIEEMQAVYDLGWRGYFFFVDDNFVGHKGKTKELLRLVIAWQQERGRPFWLITQASVDMADDPELMDLMVQAGFIIAFLGIETPHQGSLEECGKRQNQNRDLVAAIQAIQSRGIEVAGGFMIGFDSDPPDIFKTQVDFINEAAIVMAMVNLLSVPPGTRLHQRLLDEGRYLGTPAGDSIMTLEGVNFVPKMGMDRLVQGYTWVLRNLFEPQPYYQRALANLKVLAPHPVVAPPKTGLVEVMAFFIILYKLGLRDRGGRRYFWAYLCKVLFRHLPMLHRAMDHAARGYHFRTLLRDFLPKQEAYIKSLSQNSLDMESPPAGITGDRRPETV